MKNSKVKPHSKPLPQELSIGARLLRAGRALDATQVFRQFLQKHPTHAEALHLAGLAAHARGQHQEAVLLFQQAIAQSPKRAIFYLNSALVFAALDQSALAISHLRTATRLQPDFLDAWYNLGVLLTQSGNIAEAIACYREVVSLSSNHIAALNNLADLLARSAQIVEAIELLRRALKLKPDFPDAQYNLARLILEEMPIEAAHLFGEVTRSRPQMIDAFRLQAKALARAGQHEAALAVLQSAVLHAPTDANLRNDLGLVQMELGNLSTAKNEFENALATTPQHPNALYNLAFMVKSTANPHLLAQIETALASTAGMADEDRAMLYFSSGHLLEAACEYDRAFAQFEQANQLKGVAYDPTQTEHYFDAIKATFNQDFFAQRRHYGKTDALPVFIVGMPRSGTTLVEQIIASHPDAAGAGELIAFNQLANGLSHLLKSPHAFPECAKDLSHALSQELAGEYLETLRRQGRKQAQRISDKMPGNFVNLGLIALLLPQAKIIHCQRDALDTCVSCFTANFAGSLPYTYNLTHLGHYYQQYQSLMAHWQRALPSQIHTVQYETLVSDPGSEIPKLIEYIGLSWDERCLAPHKTQRAVSTASNVQVREPIYRRSIRRAVRFQSHLTPLLRELSKSTSK